jgi:AraC-like DNA-binding protein
MDAGEWSRTPGGRVANAARPATASAQDAPQRTAARVPYGTLVRHIRANILRRIVVEELAELAQLSVFQLFRAFRRERSMTPYRFVLEIRVQHAKDWLNAGATIAEAACQAGFADQSHLTRHFKRLTGMTPKAYSDRWTPRQACLG